MAEIEREKFLGELIQIMRGGRVGFGRERQQQAAGMRGDADLALRESPCEPARDEAVIGEHCQCAGEKWQCLVELYGRPGFIEIFCQAGAVRQAHATAEHSGRNAATVQPLIERNVFHGVFGCEFSSLATRTNTMRSDCTCAMARLSGS